MKTKILAAFLVAVSTLFGFVGQAAAVDVTGTVTIPDTCGLDLSANSLEFGTLETGQTSADDEMTTVMNEGSVTADVSIMGADWTDGGANSFAVGQTHWDDVTGSAYGDMTALTNLDVLFATIANGGEQDGFFKLNIPLGQAAGSYSQVITFTAECSGE